MMKSGILALALIGAATGAHAQEGFYAGFGLGYSTMSSDEIGFSARSEAESALLGLTVGYRFAGAGQLFYAVEGDADFSRAEFTGTGGGLQCPDGADGAYYCTQDATVRLRGLVGTEIGKGWEGFATLGYGVVFGTASTNSGIPDVTNGGLTYGVGMQRTLGDGMARVELVRDDFGTMMKNPSDYDATYEATTLKASYIFSF
jgi:Outer membrane protein beta-barrel domain